MQTKWKRQRRGAVKALQRRLYKRRATNVSTSITRVPRMSTTPVHHFRRMMQSIQIQGNAVYAPYVSYVDFAFSQIIQSNEFTALYDQYRINYVVTKFYLEVDPSAQTAATAVYPKIYWVRDRDSAVAPSNIDELRQDSQCRCAILKPDRPVVIKCKPNVLARMYSGAISDNYSPKWGVWLDASTSSTQHYGFKFAVDNLTNTNFTMRFERTCYFSCKQSR